MTRGSRRTRGRPRRAKQEHDDLCQNLQAKACCNSRSPCVLHLIGKHAATSRWCGDARTQPAGGCVQRVVGPKVPEEGMAASAAEGMWDAIRATRSPDIAIPRMLRGMLERVPGKRPQNISPDDVGQCSVLVLCRVVLGGDDKTPALSRAPINDLDNVDKLLLVLHRPINLVVVAGAQIDHDVLVAEKEHDCHRVI